VRDKVTRPRVLVTMSAAALAILIAGCFMVTALPSSSVASALAAASKAKQGKNVLTIGPSGTRGHGNSIGDSSGPRTVRYAVIGDSVGLTLAWGFPKDLSREGPTIVTDHTGLGCPLFLDHLPLAASAESQPPTYCSAIEHARPRWIAAKPHTDVVVVLAGTWDVYDRNVDGHLMPFGSPRFDSWFAHNLDALMAEVEGAGERIAVLTAPYEQSVTDSTLDGLPQYQSARIDHLNELYRQAVMRHPRSAELVDLNRFTSGDGAYTDTIKGVLLREDGVHFSTAGAAVIWRWLNPKLEALAKRAQ
jgi:lysophospholipase L1-like esterase